MAGVAGSTRNQRTWRRDAVELATAYGLILLVVWTPRPWQRVLWLAAAAAVVYFTCVSFDGVESMGLRRKNLLCALWVVWAALLVAGVACAVAAHLHTLRLLGGPAWVLKNYWAYALWAAVQQFLLQCYFLARLRRLLPSDAAATAAAAGIFALAHVPNPILAPITLLWGLASCMLFLRYRNLYPLALAHAVLGITVALTIPGPVIHNMRVGLGYLNYHHPRSAHADVSTEPQ